MGGPQMKKRKQAKTPYSNTFRTKKMKRMLDNIDEDLQPSNAKKLLNQEIDPDKPGLAQFYCLHCARYFIDQSAMDGHFKTKVHKRRLKSLELEPYSKEESERAAGHGSWIAPKMRKMQTQKAHGETEDY